MASPDIKQNYLSPLEFSFVIHRLPNTSFFIQEANIPGISSTELTINTPFREMHFSQDKLIYNDFAINVRVDENMKNYLEIVNWMKGLGFPKSFDQYADLQAGDGNYSDATLIIMNSMKNQNISIIFEDIFPVAIGDIQLNTTNMDVDFATVDITFKINGYRVKE